MTAITARKPSCIARPLKVLIPLIHDDLAEGNRAGAEFYRRAGEKLIEAREQVAEYQWGRWLSKNFALSKSTAYAYIKLAQDPTAQSIQEAMGGPGPAAQRWQRMRKAMRKLAIDDFKQDQQNHHEELQVYRDLAKQLINFGYRALATRLHPDRGGSKDAMMRLNQVRDQLQAVAKTRRFV